MIITRDDVKKAIESKITEYGFEFEYDDPDTLLPRIPTDFDRGYIRFNFYQEQDWDDEQNALVCNITMSGSPAVLNKQLCADELYEIAKQIKRGANLVNAINSMSVQCVKRIIFEPSVRYEYTYSLNDHQLKQVGSKSVD